MTGISLNGCSHVYEVAHKIRSQIFVVEPIFPDYQPMDLKSRSFGGQRLLGRFVLYGQISILDSQPIIIRHHYIIMYPYYCCAVAIKHSVKSILPRWASLVYPYTQHYDKCNIYILLKY